MALTYCMTSHCSLAEGCQRYESNVADNSLHRTYADFSEELIRSGEQVRCPFYLAHTTGPA